MGRAKQPAVHRSKRVKETIPAEELFDVPEKSPVISTLEPKTHNQKVALAYLQSFTPVVLLTGSAGTGKSLLAAYHVANLLKSKKIKKLYLARPAVGVGKSIGLLPGEIEEKLAPYFAQFITHLTKFLGTSYTKYCLEKKVIEMQPVEYMRGLSFENCSVVCEEAQGLTHSEMEMFLTRLGDNCQLVFTGDTKQNDLKTESGLATTVKLIEKMLQTHPSYLSRADIDRLDEGFGIVKFEPEDVVRNSLTKSLVKMYFYN
jgi:phosphate starvation-inducible PhoH-like protein